VKRRRRRRGRRMMMRRRRGRRRRRRPYRVQRLDELRRHVPHQPVQRPEGARRCEFT
jgi:hypothetical protein